MGIVYYICEDCGEQLGFLMRDDIQALGETTVKIKGECCNSIEKNGIDLNKIIEIRKSLLLQKVTLEDWLRETNAKMTQIDKVINNEPKKPRKALRRR